MDNTKVLVDSAMLSTRVRCSWRRDHVDEAHAERGFTLFEVAVSLALIAIAVIATLVLFPLGLRQLSLDRFRIYSACVANQLVDVYASADPSCAYADHEGPGPWDVSIDGRVNAPDLELRCSNPRYGLLPVPLAIARRLDSDDDEIARLIDDGGYVYYVQPDVPNAWSEDLMPALPPNDLQKLVVGVVGAAQNNAAYSFPLKRWPYYATAPAPPMHAIHHRTYGWTAAAPELPGAPGDAVRFEHGGLPTIWKANHATVCWQMCVDPDPALAELFEAFWQYLWIGGPGQPVPTTFADLPSGPVFKARLGAYIDQAIRYAAAAGLTAADIAELMDSPPPAPYPYDAIASEIAAKRVLATSYLAHALLSLTRWHKRDQVVAGMAALDAGVDLGSAYAFVPALDPGPVTHDRLVALGRNARWHYYRFTASNPYNWAVPRPIEHASFMDYPLLEPDLFRPPMRGAIWGAPAAVAQAQWWKYASPAPITTVPGDPGAPFGANLTYPLSAPPAPSATADDAAVSENGPSAGEISHLTLLNRFEPSERCRQLVMWVADWQAYEDCETCPSAPVDASRYPKAAPGGMQPVSADPRGWSGTLRPAASFDDLMWGFTDGWGDATGLEQVIAHGGSGDALRLHRALIGSYVHVYRNPEKNLAFTSPVASLATGADVGALKVRDTDRTVDMRDPAARQGLDSPADYGPPGGNLPGAGEPPEVFAGAFGADRDGDDALDRGPLPPSARLRAVTIARYNYYDLRVSGQIR
ncbi:MAG TPA: prepilin-type N-terminal cleavage/methylation domain-containing protein [Planctomycetota bacterium]|nr:prepilin-type N-terminal cleavage/methylation domain-containing protein [Planctomycetota bacterium]